MTLQTFSNSKLQENLNQSSWPKSVVRILKTSLKKETIVPEKVWEQIRSDCKNYPDSHEILKDIGRIVKFGWIITKGRNIKEKVHRIRFRTKINPYHCLIPKDIIITDKLEAKQFNPNGSQIPT